MSIENYFNQFTAAVASPYDEALRRKARGQKVNKRVSISATR